MYDVDALEKEWSAYKKKQLLRPAIVLVLLASMVAAVYFYNDTLAKWITRAGTAERIVLDSNTQGTSDANRSRQTRIVSEVNKTLATDVPSLKRPRDPSIGKIILQDGPAEDTDTPGDEKKQLDIQVVQKNKSDMAKEVERRFAYHQEKEDSLFLAKYYYGKKEYQKAQKWALETNKIDSEIEESWLIFAKSMAKMGSRIEALKVLQTYHEKSGSAKAKILIDKIRRGKEF